MASRKTERLLNLVFCLLAARRYVTRDQIRVSLEGYAGLSQAAFLRTFERDKDELRGLGVPIETGPSDPWSDEADGYRIRREAFELPPLSLSAAESTLVGLAATVWREAALEPAAARAVAKLKAGGVDVNVERAVALAPSLPTREPAFAVIWQAWISRTPVRFEYHGRSRLVEPWRLVLRQGAWYVVGLERGVGGRVFRLSRITGPAQLDDRAGPFGPVTEADLAGVGAGLDEPGPTASARLAIRPDGAGALRRRGRLVSDRAPEGYQVYQVPYAREDEIVAEACAAGADVLVLDPPELRHLVLERLRQVAGRQVEDHG
ncbi:MAG: WYL domain-containing protein [Propionibacteriaceae bacterium]|jgi:proteasome accessory factor B|nr:WYL domain-containing protein [Propionibacteriaceae bacterium]